MKEYTDPIIADHEEFEPEKMTVGSSQFLAKLGLNGDLLGVKYVTMNPAEIKVGRDDKPYKKNCWAMVVFSKDYFRGIGFDDEQLKEIKPIFVSFPMGKDGNIFWSNSDKIVHNEGTDDEEIEWVKPKNFTPFLSEEHQFIADRLGEGLRALMYALQNKHNPAKQYRNI